MTWAGRTRVLAAGWALLTAVAACSASSPAPSTPPAAAPRSPAHAPLYAPGGGTTEAVFPLTGTAWRVCWHHGAGEALAVAGAWFRPATGAPWVQVLAELRLSDVFATGHALPFDPAPDGGVTAGETEEPRRFVLAATAPPLLPLVAADLAGGGEALDPWVARHWVDRGLAARTPATARRGHALLLSAAFADAAAAEGPVTYLLRFAFRDDGGVEVRLGVATDGRSRDRVHLALWRIDLDLGGPAGDAVVVHRHLEPEGARSAFDSSTFFHVSREGGIERQAGGFTALGVLDLARQRDLRRAAGWDLVPRAAGLLRQREPFTAADLWVTRYHRGETDYRDLPRYVDDGETITGADVVLWHAVPIHLGEGWGDGVSSGGVEWGGFDLVPRHLAALSGEVEE